MLEGQRTWRPPRRSPRWWQRGLTLRQRIVGLPAGWALSHLVSILARRDLALLYGQMARRGLEIFPRLAEHRYAPRVYSASFNKLRSPLDDEAFMRIAGEVRGHGRTKLYHDRLHVLYQALHDVARRFPSGELQLLEGGAFRGGTTFFLARAAEAVSPGRAKLWAVDTFEGHTEADLGGVREGGQATPRERGTPFDASFEDVAEYLSPFSEVTVVKGRIQEVVGSLPVAPIHLMHVDMNVYRPTLFGLELARSRMAPGGIVVLDDYGNVNCPGVLKAVEEVMSDSSERGFSKLVLTTGQCWLVADDQHLVA